MEKLLLVANKVILGTILSGISWRCNFFLLFIDWGAICPNILDFNLQNGGRGGRGNDSIGEY